MRLDRFIVALICLTCRWTAHGQLPPDAVDLSLVKIPEKIGAADLCPVHLLPSDETLPTWSYKGVDYRGHTPDCQAAFNTDPDRYAETARYDRWEKNFIEAMSVIWCPVTDEIAPGGLIQWKRLGITWESCCQFCNETVVEENFPAALERLKERAKIAYEKTGGKYVNNASSPVEGAITLLNVDHYVQVEPACDHDPPWLANRDLSATYTGGAGLIMSKRCFGCHRAEGTSAIKFQTYAQIQEVSQNIQLALRARLMPPWPADISVGCFSNSQALTKKELDLLTEWLALGAPHGEGTFETPLAPYSPWTIGEPDAVIDVPHAAPDPDKESVHEFTINTGYAEDRWIVAAQVLPEDRLRIRSVDAGVLGSYYPGNGAERLPDGTGRLLKAGAKFTVRVHSRPGVLHDAPAKTRIGLIFAKETDRSIRPLRSDPMANTDFTIPSGVNNHEVVSSLEISADCVIYAVLPHLRERGKDVTYTAAFPDGSEQTLLSVPKWTAKWVMRYALEEPLKAPKGTVVTMVAHYDNSIDNLEVTDPYQDVKAGPDGEVLEGWISYTLEESATHEAKLNP